MCMCHIAQVMAFLMVKGTTQSGRVDDARHESATLHAISAIIIQDHDNTPRKLVDYTILWPACCLKLLPNSRKMHPTL